MDLVFKENVPENVMRSFTGRNLKVASDISATPRSARSNKARPALGVLKVGNKMGNGNNSVTRTPKAKDLLRQKKRLHPQPLDSVESSYGMLGGPADEDLFEFQDVDIQQLVSACSHLPGSTTGFDIAEIAQATTAWVENPEEEPLSGCQDEFSFGETPFDTASEFGDELSLTFEVESIDLGM